jgi:membrane-bound lytic murein transglycosylase B
MEAKEANLLAAIEKRYHVDRHVLLAIWAVESNFGKDKGGMKVMRSLATLL